MYRGINIFLFKKSHFYQILLVSSLIGGQTAIISKVLSGFNGLAIIDYPIYNPIYDN